MTPTTNYNGGRLWIRLRMALWTTAALLLLLPLIAMQFTDEVNWTLADFVTFGALLGVAGATCELALRMTRNNAYRCGVGVAVAAAFLLVWVNLAVGIIGEEGNDANFIFFGVLAVGIIGAYASGFQPAGMARALFATALAQASVLVVALGAGWVPTGTGLPHEILQLFLLNGFFSGLWLTSALLFRKSAQAEPEPRMV